jgi:hypothetical protein
MKLRTFSKQIVVLPVGALQCFSAATSGEFAQEKMSNSSFLRLICDAQNAGAIYAARKFRCRTAIPNLIIHTN